MAPGVSLIAVVLAALSLTLDFAFIEACVASQASRGWVDVATLPAQ